MKVVDLSRFGKTDPKAGCIERLCNCGLGEQIKNDKEKHTLECKAITCTDGYPHSGDPCVVCESTEEEWQYYLNYVGVTYEELVKRHNIGEKSE